MTATFQTMTIVDGCFYDTEVIEGAHGPSHHAFFANTRAFASPSAGPKAHKTHTNLVGIGGMLPRGYSILVRAILVELNGASAQDRKAVEASSVTLHLGGHPNLETSSGADALKAGGARLKKPVEIVELMNLGVDVIWRPGALPTGSFLMKVSLLGAMKVPVTEDTRARAREIYGRPRPKAKPDLFVFVHQTCAEADEEVARPPMTRRALESEKVRELDRAGVKKNDPRRETRRAWWCARCKGKVKQSDVIVAVKVMA